MTRTTRVAAGAALALAACGDGQAGSGYKGEPLMALNGVVTSSSATLSAGLVPALAFISPNELFGFNGTFNTYFVKGEVEGTFPSAFTMRIYEPPPDEALVSWFDGEPSYTQGQIAAVWPDQARRLRKTSVAEPVLDDAGVHVGDIQRDELCSDTGQCLTGYPAHCPLGEADPNREWPCGQTFPDEYPWEVYGYSENYQVLYFDGDVAAGSVLSRVFGEGDMIPAGYHGVRNVDLTTLAPEEAEAREQCLLDAYQRAIDGANAVFGTHATMSHFEGLHLPERQGELMRQEMIAIAELGCSTLLELVADPGSHPIELPFTDQPQRFTW